MTTELRDGADTRGWALVRGKTAQCGWRLLAVHLVFAAVGWGELKLWERLGEAGLWHTRDIAALAVHGLAAAWCWSAGLRILDGGTGLASALRPDVARVARLGGWLVLLNVTGVLGLIADIDVDAFAGLVFSPVWKAVALSCAYLVFAAALLPMAVLLEGRGVRRAWRLTHGSWRTVAWVLPVVVLDALASAVLTSLPLTAAGVYPRPSSYPLLQAAALAGGAVKGAAVAVLLYAAYRRAAAPRGERADTPQGGLQAGPPRPQVRA
ncbi:hypothetical protein [Streptomyces sp. NRRL S-350]|uniref:hypothetical protein n=1 Tax=Streptomyces sp. NRRL S-350 TaxID=1463902 RepID=UPI0004BE4B96|nr:hypothetical protein [Streptomyces sp. NRRL S-350]